MDEGVRDLVCLRHLAAMDKGCSGCSCAARAPSRTETLSPAAEYTGQQPSAESFSEA